MLGPLEKESYSGTAFPPSPLHSPKLSMTTIRRFTCDDFFNFNSVNLDYFTETVSTEPQDSHRTYAIACQARENVPSVPAASDQIQNECKEDFY